MLLRTSRFLWNTNENQPEPPRPEGQTDVIELRCDPIDTVHVAFIGLGGRGKGAVRRYTFLEGVKIVALCDLVPENLEKTQEILKEKAFRKQILIQVRRTGRRYVNGKTWTWYTFARTGTCIPP